MKRTAKSDTRSYFILMRLIKEEPRLSVGTIWLLEQNITADLLLVTKYEGDDAGSLKQIESIYLKELTYEKVHLLLAIPEPNSNRLKVVNDTGWIKEGLEIIVGTIVRIYDFPGLESGSLGTVQFKGRLPGRNGISFGIELNDEHAGKGTTDGTFRYKKLFSCKEDCGIFVSILKIRKAIFHSDDVTVKARPVAEGRSNNNLNNVYDVEVPRNDQINNLPDDSHLEIYERVVWMSDEGPEFGTVKWIGILPYSPDNKTVIGVEFDNPVGTGTGKYKGQQLFRAKRNHASLIPVLGLLKASVYMSMMSSDGGHQEPSSIEYQDFKVGNESISEQFPTSDIRSKEEWITNSVVHDGSHVDNLGKNFSELNMQLTARGIDGHEYENFKSNEKKLSIYHDGITGKRAQTNPVPNRFQADFQTEAIKDGGVKYNTQGAKPKVSTTARTSSVTKSFKDSGVLISNVEKSDGIYLSSNLKADSGVETSGVKHVTMGEYEQQFFEFQVGSRVCVILGMERYGVIRWIGTFPQSKTPDRIVAGVEMELVDQKCYTDGTFLGEKVFHCPPYKGFFLPLNKCLPDRR